MTLTLYIYTISEHFDQGLHPGQLYTEIQSNTNISPNIINVFHQVNNDVDISFESSLSSGELTTVNNIIDVHTPFQAPEIFSTANYIQINSTLSDSSAIIIDASNQNGGIDIDAGVGGIIIDSRNAMQVTSNATSFWRTLNVGNLDFESKGILNIEGQGGINIGANNDAQAINIGTSSSSRPISIGNQTGTTSININSGNGGFSLDSVYGNSNVTLTTDADDQELRVELLGNTASSLHIRSEGNQVDALKFSTLTNSGGMDIDIGSTGFDLDTSGPINLATSAAGGSITLDATSGGLTLSAGVYGTAINSLGTGLIALGNFSGTGDITLGNNSEKRTVKIGNRTTNSQLFLRHSDTGGKLISQGDHTSLSNSNQTLTISQLLTGILSGTPTTDRTLTLPTADDAAGGISNVSANDAIEFVIINKGSGGTDPSWTVAAGTDGTLEGNGEIPVAENNASTWKGSGSSVFRLRFTAVSSSGNSYTVYRIS